VSNIVNLSTMVIALALVTSISWGWAIEKIECANHAFAHILRQ